MNRNAGLPQIVRFSERLGLPETAIQAVWPACRAVDSRRPYSVSQTLDQLETVLKEITVFARIDHAGEAALMVAHPSVAIDLPMKALAWQDATGKVWVGFNSADLHKDAPRSHRRAGQEPGSGGRPDRYRAEIGAAQRTEAG